VPTPEPAAIRGRGGESASARTRGRPEFKDDGIVLRTYRLGESDKILRVLTRENGKRSAVGKGVRKTSSRFGARLEPLTHVKLFLHRGRSMDTVKQAEIINSFQEVRDDLDLFVAASSMAELVDFITEEGEPNPELFELLLLGLQLLKEYPSRSPLVLALFQFKVMAQAGFELMVTRCASCAGEPGDEVWFSLALGGVVCERCRAGRAAESGRLVKLSPPASGTLRWMSSSRLGEWPPGLDDSPSAEVRALMSKVLEHWMEREFRSHRVAKAMPAPAGDEIGGQGNGR